MALMSADVGNELDTPAFDAMTGKHAEDALMRLFLKRRQRFQNSTLVLNPKTTARRTPPPTFA